MTRSDMMGMTPVGTRRDQERSVRGHGVHRTVNALRQEIQSSDRATQCSALSIHSTVVMDAPWKMSLAKYSGKKEAFIEGAKDSKLPRKVRKYYQKQLALIEAYEDLERLQHEDARDQTKLDDEAMTTLRLSQLSFFANFVLLVIKSIASVKSGSISVISSVVDSSFDLLSGIIIWYTSQAVQKTDYHLYPFGRRRLEPLAIFLLSVLMSMASLQLIWQSVERAVLFAKDLGNVPEFDSVTVAITCTVVAIKFFAVPRVLHG
ncbi:metal tolerance protein 11-like isoform X2 [Pomacea canaliculata]|uniref:metal tolerance protein 11-like isoform X2 n=1 Tax=Pomacea canaliculata TaxID=400727 RepID=UPI000D73CB72|nr:metal tolerance protein 11-like isoform X2 [Pomacea canaliculata]XP_025084070.1 metal tolerance protein 11-like isoform X2 [Pomacea canaliculata]